MKPPSPFPDHDGDFYAAPRVRAAAEVDAFGQPIRPGVVVWFKIYAAALGALYLLLALFMGMAWIGILTSEIREMDPQERAMFSVMFPAFAFFMLILAGIFLAPLALPRKPWVWIYSIVLIGLGMTSCALWPATIPLLIFWLKPQVQRYYGRAAQGV